VRDGRAAHPHDAQQILLDRAQPGYIVEIEARTEWRGAVIVDEDIEPAKTGDGFCDDALAIDGLADIAWIAMTSALVSLRMRSAAACSAGARLAVTATRLPSSASNPAMA
jgi:hypothetical protein